MNHRPLMLLLLVILAGSAEAESDRPILIFGIVPQQTPSVLARSWYPLLTYLSERLPFDLRFATAPSIPEFERRLSQGRYDVAYMNPYHYVHFHEKPGYQALARERDKRLSGIIVVRHDSPIQRLQQLDDASLALPAPAAFAASLLPRALLPQQGIHPRVDYVNSHDSVYLAVSRGLFDAGGGVKRTLNNQPAAIREQLRILWQTPGFTPHAFAYHPRVPEASRQALLKALVDLHDQKEGHDLLDTLGFHALIAANDSDWDDVRALKLETLSEIHTGL
ncbi:phosphate/phosphite/phosphonate ABC transporter substrate-binding protein [Alloalcanivorax sp. C16-2]|uniref:phosphate/phosphite/phosphonate ABC transporter substrate-binding protein n=1 Tax=Alloalcanivorax TaxID=3020832 RepID=UPI0019315501|nr:phosphate/phosphite/phosphonate ABC transporter substrate-binding protein [Alloalcanivorax marinus]MBL7251089.1 phosphate/phosphite/phosphonate ABC transporter substrate-binding protein [Alloalcanivorax marinus]